MHIILAFLGSIVTILILLNRLAEAGIDLGGLNPFLWQRRRKWRRMYEGNPIYQITDPMEVSSILMLAIAKIDGDISAEEKNKIKELFEKEFNLTRRDAIDLMISSVHLMKDMTDLLTSVDKIMKPSLDSYTEHQINATLDLLNQVARVGGEPSDSQNEFIEIVTAQFSKRKTPSGEWAK